MRLVTLMNTLEIITQFYDAFVEGNAKNMVFLYDEKIEFEDPAFGKLHGEEAHKMWEMLIKRSNGNLKVSYTIYDVAVNFAVVHWTATYPFARTGRTVTNHIVANIVLKNHKIIKHTDYFNLWKWSRQALGWKGFLLGWTPFFKNKLQQQTQTLLKDYIKNQRKSA
ncbi:MAG: nuclear transport factor 2 family protein [Bacteroidetes bacterium HGW-Bacteroidetes-2]|nr:MAG: nuclear transport factor 2 family protein [Bacteroidetes bacterium HGW-Bacteroidetes-2]